MKIINNNVHNDKTHITYNKVIDPLATDKARCVSRCIIYMPPYSVSAISVFVHIHISYISISLKLTKNSYIITVDIIIIILILNKNVFSVKIIILLQTTYTTLSILNLLITSLMNCHNHIITI